MSTNTTSPTPLIIPAAGWGGDDGNWSTFTVSVGTPPQTFSLLPSLTGSETWVVFPEGCEGPLATVSNCGALRGVHNFQGNASSGFQYTKSTTWQSIGIYKLSNFEELFEPTANALYGFDTVTIPAQSSNSDHNLSYSNQVIAGYAAGQSWLGSLGVGSAATSFSVREGNYSSLLLTMLNANKVPSGSVGYTAGAYYSSSQTPASLIFGGYDQARFNPSNISFAVGNGSLPQLPVSIRSMVGDGLDGNLYSLMSGAPVTALIDSTLSQSTFPQAMCDRFVKAYGLKYDNSTGLYLVNSTTHSSLLVTNPNITITLAPPANSSQTTNIVLPYAAFNLQAGIPLYNYSTNYFPIRPAANDNQITLGRQFLQEAYVFVDWERGNFTLGQAIHQNATTNIITVDSPASNSATSNSSSSHLTGGDIAGIVIGVLAAVILLAAAIFLLLRRRKRQRLAAQKEDVFTQDEKNLNNGGANPDATEIHSTPVYELHQDPQRSELSGQFYAELPGDVPVQEADSIPVGLSHSTVGSGHPLLYGGQPVSPMSSSVGAHRRNGGPGQGSMSIVSPVSGSGYGSDSGTGSSSGAGSSGETRVLLLGELGSQHGRGGEQQLAPPRYQRRDRG